MKRKIIKIDEEKCNGCALCVSACHEGAIGMVNGKAKLLRDDYCDGLGDCLPACPVNAISFVEREALSYNEAEVKKNMYSKKEHKNADCPATATKIFNKQEDKVLPCGCPGTSSQTINTSNTEKSNFCAENNKLEEIASELRQWPVQIKLVPVNASYFENADILIAADCSAFACGDFHGKYMKGKVTLVGCPKLDSIDYTEKLAAIVKNNIIKSITVIRMEVPCCTGIAKAALDAVNLSGKDIKVKVITLNLNGKEI